MSRQRGFTLVEVLVSMMMVAVVFTVAGPLLIRSTEINKAQQLKLAAQADARNCMTLVLNTLRTAGWDPRNMGFTPVVLDPDPNTDNFIRTLADLTEDTDTSDEGEDVTIRHTGGRLEWRRWEDTTQPFVVLSENVTNDEDGNGTPEPMFTPDSVTDPQRITVKITTRSAEPDPRTRQYLRFTIESEVFLRGTQ